MLVISRKSNETLVVGDKIEIRVLGAKNDSVRLGIVAPRDVTVVRGEILEKVREQNLASLSLDLKALQRAAEKTTDKRRDMPSVEIPSITAVQEVVSWLVHDVRNFLTPVHGEIQLALLDCPDGEIREGLQSMHANINGLNDWLRATARLGCAPSFVDGKVGLREALARAIEQWSGKAVVSLSCPDYLEVPKTDPALGAVLSHLFDNAEEAEATEIKVVALRGERGVELSIKDNGVGMDRATLERLKKPLFSTKTNHRGRGLFSVRNWLTGFGGKLVVASRLGGGTEVTMLLGEAPLKTLRKACEVILKAPYRGAAHNLLDSLGFRVYLAELEGEAEILKRRYPEVEVLDIGSGSVEDWLNSPG